MKFLAIVRRKTEEFSDEEIAEFLEPEAQRVRELYMQGFFRAVFSRGDEKGAVVELECKDIEQAKAILSTLPFAQQKMIDTQLIPLLPYRGFAPR
jgi:muconolactone delta-isomerase